MAEKQLSEIEEKYWQLFDISSAGVSLSNFPKGEIIKINDGYLNMIEYAREEVLGRTSDEVGWLDLADRQKMYDTFFASNNMLKSYEINFTKKSGKKGTALFSAVLADIGGEKYILNTVFDITERKKAEDKIRENEQKFRQVFNISPAGMALVNSTTRQITEINDAYLWMVGYSRDEVIGHSSVEVGWLEENELQKLIDIFYDNNKLLRNYEINYKNKSGQNRTALISAESIVIDGLDHFLIVFQDITGRKMAEQETRESEKKFRTLFEMSQVGISLIHFPSTEVVEINDAYLKMIGFTRQEVIGRSSVEVGWFESKDQQKMGDAFYQNKKTLQDYEVEYKKKSGEKGTALVSYDQITINQKIFLLATVQDITVRLEAEKRKTQLVEQLAQVNKDLESFSYTVSHDLRAPLRSISGFTQILESKNSEKLDESSRQLIDKIKNQAKRMGGLIDDLLAFSREAKAEITKSTIDMTSLVKSVLEEYSKELNATKVILGDLLPASGDGAALKQVFVNLITNAQKYSAGKEHPVVEIGSYSKGNENVYFVKDNGAGFDMKYYDHLFKPFQRLHSRDEYEGSGIGLAIVNKIVTKHGGRCGQKARREKGPHSIFLCLMRSIRKKHAVLGDGPSHMAHELCRYFQTTAMKRSAAALFSLLLFFSEVVYSQDFNLLPPTINPAFTGLFDGKLRAVGLYKHQWLTPKPSFTAYGTFVDGKIDPSQGHYFALGGGFLEGRTVDGSFSNFSGVASMAYHKKIGRPGKNKHPVDLGAGFQAEYIQRNLVLPDFSNNSLPSVFKLGSGTQYLVMNVGLSFMQSLGKKFSYVIGLSGNNLSLFDDGTIGMLHPLLKVTSSYIGIISTNWILTDRISLRPQMLYVFNRDFFIGGNEFRYRTNNVNPPQTVYMSVWWRTGDVIVVSPGYEFSYFRMGAGFDYYTSSHDSRKGGIQLIARYIMPNPEKKKPEVKEQ